MAEVLNDIVTNLKRGWIFEVVFASIIGILIATNYYFAILMLGAIFAVVISIQHPLRVLFLFFLILPFSGHEWLLQPLFSVPGAKITNLLGLYIIFLAVLNYRSSGRMPRRSIAFTFLYTILFTVAIYRSLDYLHLINRMNIEPLSVERYWLSDWMRQIIYFLPFIIILKYANTKNSVRFIFNSISVSTTCIALYILYLYFMEVPDRLNIDVAADLYGKMLGLHRNQIATFFILGFPLTLSRFFLKKNIVNCISVAIVIAATGFCFSRTAYATVIGSFILYLAISNRKNYLPVFLILSIIAGSVISTTVIIERASKGLRSGDASEISAGRTDQIWLPLIKEYAGNSKLLLLGQGRYAMLNTESHKKGIAQDFVMHPHNMYIEQVLDAGLLGLGIIGWFIIGTLIPAFGVWKVSIQSPSREYYCGGLVSVIAYLVAGMAGLSLFPLVENSFFWASLATLIVILQQLKSEEADNNEG